MTDQSVSPAIDTGLGDQVRDSVARGLTAVLASSFALALKTQNFHWNVTGPRFHGLHAQFEEQYTDLYSATDDVAERIRALGVMAPGSLAAFGAHSAIADAPENPPAANEMVAILARDHDAMARLIRGQIGGAAEAGDEVTVGLLTDRLGVHEKTAWMLRSSVG